MKTQIEIDMFENRRCVEILHKEHDFPFDGFEIVRAMRAFADEQWNAVIDKAAKLCGADEKESILKLKR